MKFLIDQALSPLVAEGLKESAASDHRILISADTDFGAIIALRRSTRPSVMLVRRAPRQPALQVEVLVANLPHHTDFFQQGAIVVFDDTRIRIRLLLIGDG